MLKSLYVIIIIKLNTLNVIIFNRNKKIVRMYIIKMNNKDDDDLKDFSNDSGKD